MSSTAKLTAEQIENLAKEIREFLLEHGLWQDVDIYFNGKRFTQHDPVTGKVLLQRQRASDRGREPGPKNVFRVRESGPHSQHEL